jgi:hypothetical protein
MPRKLIMLDSVNYFSSKTVCIHQRSWKFNRTKSIIPHCVTVSISNLSFILYILVTLY